VSYQPSPQAIARAENAREIARRSAFIAALSTIAFAAVVVLVVTKSKGFHLVGDAFFNWRYAKHALPSVLSGLWLNLRILVITEILVLIFGLALALARTTRNPLLFPLRLVAAAYSDIFRGLPLLLVLLLIGFGLPGLQISWIPNSPVFLGVISLTLTYTAYVGEVIRAGIDAVPPTQKMAARALGLSHGQAQRHVILPQAFRKVIPPLLNDLISLQKDSGLISVLGAIDAIRAAQIETAQFFNFTSYVVAGVLFVLLTIPLTRFTDYLTAKKDRSRQAQGGW
jgi:polar amino acid transport system permease protein